MHSAANSLQYRSQERHMCDSPLTVQASSPLAQSLRPPFFRIRKPTTNGSDCARDNAVYINAQKCRRARRLLTEVYINNSTTMKVIYFLCVLATTAGLVLGGSLGFERLVCVIVLISLCRPPRRTCSAECGAAGSPAGMYRLSLS